MRELALTPSPLPPQVGLRWDWCPRWNLTLGDRRRLARANFFMAVTSDAARHSRSERSFESGPGHGPGRRPLGGRTIPSPRWNLGLRGTKSPGWLACQPGLTRIDVGRVGVPTRAHPNRPRPGWRANPCSPESTQAGLACQPGLTRIDLGRVGVPTRAHPNRPRSGWCANSGSPEST